MATSTTKLTPPNSFVWIASFRFAQPLLKMRLASLGAARRRNRRCDFEGDVDSIFGNEHYVRVGRYYGQWGFTGVRPRSVCRKCEGEPRRKAKASLLQLVQSTNNIIHQSELAQFQPLNIVTSYNRQNQVGSLVLSDFHAKSKSTLFSALLASMTVPGVAGPPSKLPDDDNKTSIFDAFCCEPIPYRLVSEAWGGLWKTSTLAMRCAKWYRWLHPLLN